MAIMARDAHDEGIPETKIAKDLGVDALTCENSRLRRNGSAYATGGPAG